MFLLKDGKGTGHYYNPETPEEAEEAIRTWQTNAGIPDDQCNALAKEAADRVRAFNAKPAADAAFAEALIGGGALMVVERGGQPYVVRLTRIVLL